MQDNQEISAVEPVKLSFGSEHLQASASDRIIGARSVTCYDVVHRVEHQLHRRKSLERAPPETHDQKSIHESSAEEAALGSY